ncbi:hypothetical protein C8R46DRAFT_1262107 [Mycena filopes]|nr:hypothetical protein C8R46DRAFT_1262107 [Mycena filopes]
MNNGYSSLPTTANGSASYPPLQTKALFARLTPSAPPTKVRRLLLFVGVLALSSTLIVYLVFSSSFFTPFSSSSTPYSSADDNSYFDAEFDGGSGNAGNGDGPGSPFFRDAHPALHARLFLARAQAEIRARGLDTCGGRLSTPMVEGYMKAAVPYCQPRDAASPLAAHITCFPARAPSSPNGWWPYPQAFCSSSNLAHTAGWGSSNTQTRGLFTGACTLTDAGRTLKDAMGKEVFLGTEFAEPDALAALQPNRNKNGGGGGGLGVCAENLTHPVLFVPRQDRWNPFHVGEDLVTTFLALTLFSLTPPPGSSGGAGWFSNGGGAPSAASNAHLLAALPESYAASRKSPPSSKNDFAALRDQLAHELAHTAELQLVFSDDYLPTDNLFAPLWDRIGGRVPRRMGLEGLGVGGGPTCLHTAFHSVGAGASLLSGTGVGQLHTCASELVWGAGLWLRWLLRVLRMWGRRGVEAGLGKRGGGPVEAQAPIQVLFLSRDKFDTWTKHSSKTKKLSPWQEARHITNEAALLTGLRAGLAGLCRVVTAVPGMGRTEHTPGSHDCTYTDADALPAAWGVRMHAREAGALGTRDSSAPPAAPAPGLGAKDTEGAVNERADPTPRALRFATLDPTTSGLAAQLGAVGRADVVVSVHAGALGLSLFLPTGRASVVELVTTGAAGNYHFHNMAHMLGMQYVRVDVLKTVDVPAVVRAVREVVEQRLR